MWNVSGEINRTVGTASLDEFVVCSGRKHIVKCGIVISAHPHINVRGHMHQVAGRGGKVG